MKYDLREALAAVSHEIWIHWMEYLMPKALKGAYDPETLARWQRQMATPYPELSEKEKESDRHQADKIMEAVKNLSGWRFCQFTVRKAEPQVFPPEYYEDIEDD